MTTQTTMWALVLIGLAALLLALPARAQNARTITLGEAVALAQTQGVAVQRAALTVEEREAAVAEARGRYWPALSLYTNSAQRYGLAFDQTSGQLTQASTQALDFGAEAEWTVFDGFARQATLAGARADRAEAEGQRERAGQTAVHEALRAFYQAVVDEAAIRIARENAEAQRQQLALVEAQIAAGARPTTEVFGQQERVAEAELAVLEAERAHRLSVLRLVRLLALDPAETYRFAAPSVAESDTAAVARLDEAALVHDALGRRSDLRAQEAALTAASAEIRASRAGALPSVALVAGYGTSFTSSGEPGFGTQLGDNRGGALGLRIGFPLFDRGVTRSRVRAADARLERLRVEAADRQREVTLEVREAVFDYRVLTEQVRVAGRRVAAARAALDAEAERYRLGMTTLTALGEVRARAVEAEVGRERARYALAFQRALLDYRTGALGAVAPLPR